jgi:4-amino-4-deoxy-L-arabinose transferase-like glycosyltransferase
VQFADVVLAVLLFLIIALPWYLVMWLVHGSEYLVGFFIGDNFERFATERFNEPRPWWFYLPIIAGGLLPWTPLLLTWLSPVVQFVTRRRDVGTLDQRLILWALFPLAFFTLSIGKQPRYILPVLPPLAVLLASAVIERTSEWRSLDGARRRPRPNTAVVTGCVLGGGVLLVLATLVFRARTLFLNVAEMNSLVVAGILAVGGVAVVIVSLTGAWRSAPGLLAFATAVSFAALPYGVLSAAGDSTVKQMADHVRQAHAGTDAPIGTYKVFVRNLVFYSGLKSTDIIHDEHLTQWLASNPRALLVMLEEDADRLAAQGLQMQRLTTLPYFNDGVIKIRMLLWPNPATDLQQVVLVRIEAPPTRASLD